MAAKQQPQKTGTDTQNKAVLVGSGLVAGLLLGVVIMNFTGSTGSPAGPAPRRRSPAGSSRGRTASSFPATSPSSRTS